MTRMTYPVGLGQLLCELELRVPPDMRHPPRFIFVTPSHQYPLGPVMSLSRRRTLLEFAVHAITEGIDALGEVTVRICTKDGDYQTFGGHGYAFCFAPLAWTGARSTTNNVFTNYNPLLNSYVAFNLTQPLLRNRSVDQYRQQLDISHKQRDASDVSLNATVITTGPGVIIATATASTNCLSLSQ